MIKQGERMMKRGGGEKENVVVNYFLAIMIFTPTRLRPGAFFQKELNTDSARTESELENELKNCSILLCGVCAGACYTVLAYDFAAPLFRS